MKNTKNIWVLFLAVLLVALQPVVSYGNSAGVLTSVVDTQEEASLFKTKASKALVFEEIQPTPPTPKIFLKFFKTSVFEFESTSLQEAVSAVASETLLIDFRSILTTQIFPFHFFL